MIRLSNSTLVSLPPGVARPAYDRTRVTPGIAHIGVGQFHRAHQALYLDRCLALAGQERWGIVGIGVLDGARERHTADALHAQQCLYSLTEFPARGRPTVRVVGSLVDYLHAPRDAERVLEQLAAPDLRIVTLTLTEGGYNMDEAGHFLLETPAVARDLDSQVPTTAFGLVAEALRRRRERGLGPFTVLSCDNLRQNGDVARSAFLSFARARVPSLANWMEEHVTFPNGMVDRITPGVTEHEAARLNEASGLDDALPVYSEAFIQWVVEDRFCAGRPPLERVGVQFTDDVGPYEQVKLRLLNASHSLLAFPGLLMGYRFVAQAMEDPALVSLLQAFLREDAEPLLQAPPGLSVRDYGDTVLERFSNPAISDQLLRIASDSASKLPNFVEPTAREVLRQGRDSRRLAFLLAAFCEYLRGVDERGHVFLPVEPHLTEAEVRRAHATDLKAPLGLAMFREWGLAEHPGFVRDCVHFRRELRFKGVSATLAELTRSMEEASA